MLLAFESPLFGARFSTIISHINIVMVNFVLKFLYFHYRGNRVVQNHTKRQMIANISDPLKEIMVAESEYLTVALKFYF